jgi:predicted DNA-binding protein (UPF0251 family)
MVRPKLCRKIRCNPNITYFKPRGVPLKDLKEIILHTDEYEAIRLKDLEGLEQGDCAGKMKISQPTFHRIIVSARKKIADAIINGKAIKLEK